MPAAIDHLFICTAAGAPAAERLRDLGLTEGSRNRHPGQGTANRRFFFANFMLELLWVEDAAEAQGPQAGRMRLWDRWSSAGRSASPFGIILRPGDGSPGVCPFPSWEYRPATMPDLALHVASDVVLEEPIWYYMATGRPPAAVPADLRRPTDHPAGMRDLTALRLSSPALPETSVTVAMARLGIIELADGPGHFVELEFDGAPQGNTAHLAPDLPLRLRW